MGKRNGGGEVEGVKKGTKEGGEVVGQTREKEGKRRGERGWLGGGRWVRREWGEGAEGEGHASVLWNITIQKHHTVLPYKIIM